MKKRRVWVGLMGSLLLTVSCAARRSGVVYASASTGNWEIYSAFDQDTQGSAENLTRYPASERFPDFATDHQTLVFSSDRQGSFNLYLMDLQGQNLRPLSPSPYPDVYPRWSPSEDQIVFVSARNDRNENLYLLDQVWSDNMQLQQLTDDPAPDYDPHWNAKGTQIVFVSERQQGKSELFLLDLKSRAQEQLTADGLPKRFPTFSSTGHLAYTVQQASGQWQVCWGSVAAVKTGQGISCAKTAWAGDLRWQDDRYLVFTEIDGEQSGVYRLDTQTQQRERLLSHVREWRPF